VHRPVVFLSDFGLADAFVGVCHGVIERIAPGCRVIDLTHDVPPHGVRRGAFLLAQAAPYMPEDAVYLAVVDPGVGSERRSLAVEAESGAMLVGPDNGVLSLAWEALGGAARARSIEATGVLLDPVSATFHGRDVFAPAAAHLALGMALEEFGPAIELSSLAQLVIPRAETSDGTLRCQVIGADRFGNVELSATEGDLGSAGLANDRMLVIQTPTGEESVERARTFAAVEPGRPALILDSSGWLTIVVNGGSAAKRCGLRTDDTVVVRRLATGPDR
jgi:S-adenosyl-L-methionine hydrolase (adenosine-forming)